mmetsp:Transcript_16666/g.46587  ORF Transcript_16666/g.46587 Transcript_16666/m.46587 type:complete len:312 (-) Transcript_16666:787-1722(-)
MRAVLLDEVVGDWHTQNSGQLPGDHESKPHRQQLGPLRQEVHRKDLRLGRLRLHLAPPEVAHDVVLALRVLCDLQLHRQDLRGAVPQQYIALEAHRVVAGKPLIGEKKGMPWEEFLAVIHQPVVQNLLLQVPCVQGDRPEDLLLQKLVELSYREFQLTLPAGGQRVGEEVTGLRGYEDPQSLPGQALNFLPLPFSLLFSSRVLLAGCCKLVLLITQNNSLRTAESCGRDICIGGSSDRRGLRLRCRRGLGLRLSCPFDWFEDICLAEPPRDLLRVEVGLWLALVRAGLRCVQGLVADDHLGGVSAAGGLEK